MLELAVGGRLTRQRIETAIGYDLAVAGMDAKLFLPNLAGVAQGPGFPNLSCLGELSDRVLCGGAGRMRAKTGLVSLGAPVLD